MQYVTAFHCSDVTAQTLITLELAILVVEKVMPSPEALHQFIVRCLSDRLNLTIDLIF